MLLNSEQQKAVEEIECPLIIIAGAGTGKTRVITEKIIHLINQKKISPKNILGLTFSNRASMEMQERISERLSSFYYDMEITTFHSFCNRVLREYGHHIGIPNNFILLDNIGQILFLLKIYDKLDLNYYSSLSSPISVLNSFSRFFSRAKDEIISPDEFENYVLEIKEAKKNEPQNFESEIEELEEESRVYRIYQEEMLKCGYLDFNDLIIYVIRLFQKRPHILNKYQDKFQYILVDEFQDTNIAQIELLRLL